MTRYILYGIIIIYLLYLGLRTFLNKFQYFKKYTKGPPDTKDKNNFSKKDLNNIEDADYEEINKK